MIGVNELTDLNCHSLELLEKFLVVLSPYAPHICEELWALSGHSGSVLDATYPIVEEKYLIETSKEYPLAINGKTRATLIIDLNATQEEVEKLVLQEPVVIKWLEGNPPKKIIFVKNKMINVVV
jgi:leucyl-tRNA synthetase